jgi:hypothetical protein
MKRMAVLVCVLVASGCGVPIGGSTHDAGPTALPDGGTRSDAGDVQGEDRYLAGMTKVGADGQLQVRLVSSDPIPEFTGVYNWTVEVLDINGSVANEATVLAEPRMPEHGHGTFPATTAAEATEGTGRLILNELDLFMPGTWEVTLTISAGGLTDTVVFAFPLEG